MWSNFHINYDTDTNNHANNPNESERHLSVKAEAKAEAKPLCLFPRPWSMNYAKMTIAADAATRLNGNMILCDL